MTVRGVGGLPLAAMSVLAVHVADTSCPGPVYDPVDGGTAGVGADPAHRHRRDRPQPGVAAPGHLDAQGGRSPAGHDLDRPSRWAPARSAATTLVVVS